MTVVDGSEGGGKRPQEIVDLGSSGQNAQTENMPSLGEYQAGTEKMDRFMEAAAERWRFRAGRARWLRMLVDNSLLKPHRCLNSATLIVATGGLPGHTAIQPFRSICYLGLQTTSGCRPVPMAALGRWYRASVSSILSNEAGSLKRIRQVCHIFSDFDLV